MVHKPENSCLPPALKMASEKKNVNVGLRLS